MKWSMLLLATIVLSLSAAFASPPEIAHIHPDYAGGHISRGMPHILTGEGLNSPGLEVYTWALQPEDAVILETARLLGTPGEPRPPAVPPLEEKGRAYRGIGSNNGGYWMTGSKGLNVIYRWRGLQPDFGVQVFDIDGRTMVVNLAAARGDMHTSVVWLKNADGFSKPYLINVAQPRWMSSDSIQQGDRLRIYGPGINYPFKQTRIAFRKGDGVRIMQPDDAPFPFDYGVRGNETRLREVVIPMDMEPGVYRVYVHNGFGGQFGWSEAGPLKIEARRKVEEKIFRVREYGALGDGEANDTAAVRKVIAAAVAAGGGVVYFAPGTYIVDESILVPSGVSLRGAARENTIIKGVGFDPNIAPEDGRRTWSSAAPQPCSVILLQPYTGAGSISVRGETARGTAGQTIQVVMGDEKTPPLPRGANYGRISLRDIQVNGDFGCASSYTPRRIAYGIEVRDSLFYGSFGLFAITIRADYINNRVYGGSISGMGFYDSLIERNIIRDGATRLTLFPPTHNTYLRYNEMYNFGTQGSGVSGAAEAFLPHGGTKKYIGKVTSGGADTLTDRRRSWTPGELSDGRIWHMGGTSTVLITAGRGFGQYRQVKANTADTITVDRPWRVVPDESSEYVVGCFYVDNMWYGNYLDGMGHFQLSAEHINVVVEKHYDKLAAGIMLEGREAGGYQRPSLAWYNMLLNNHMEGSTLAFRVYEAPERSTEGPLFFGNSVVGNNIMQPKYRDLSAVHTTPTAGFAFVEPFPAGHVGTGRTSHTIIAGNTVSNAEVGLLVRDWARKTFILNNDFQQVGLPILDTGSGSIERGNRQSSFSLEETGKAQKQNLPDAVRPDPLQGKELPAVKYDYPEVKAAQPSYAFAADMLRNVIPLYTYIPTNVESAKVQDDCAGNLKKLYAILQAYEKKNGSLPKADFYAEKPLTDAASLLVLLGKEARPFLRCPAAGPDFDKLGWPNYIWNDELSGRKLSDVKDRKGTWLLMDFSAPHAWLVSNGHAGHRGGVNVLFADGSVQWTGSEELGKRWPFK